MVENTKTQPDNRQAQQSLLLTTGMYPLIQKTEVKMVFLRSASGNKVFLQYPSQKPKRSAADKTAKQWFSIGGSIIPLMETLSDKVRLCCLAWFSDCNSKSHMYFSTCISLLLLKRNATTTKHQK